MKFILSEKIAIKASKVDTWKVISDIGAVSEYVPDIQFSKWTSDGGLKVGAGRYCEFDKVCDARTIEWTTGYEWRILHPLFLLFKYSIFAKLLQKVVSINEESKRHIKRNREIGQTHRSSFT